jgi:hypothetical protein
VTGVGPDGITLGELSRQLSDWRTMAQQNFAAIDRRLQDLATQTVPGAVYQADRARYDDRLVAQLKLSDERYALIQKALDELADAQREAQQEAKERSKRIANNRTVIAMALFTGFLLPILILVMQKAIGL